MDPYTPAPDPVTGRTPSPSPVDSSLPGSSGNHNAAQDDADSMAASAEEAGAGEGQGSATSSTATSTGPWVLLVSAHGKGGFATAIHIILHYYLTLGAAG
jgi:hypothetical protein